MSELKRSIVTAAGPNMQPLLRQYSLPRMEWYGEAWDYTVSAHVINQDAGEHGDPRHHAARWAKLGIIRQALKECDLLVWLDADTIVCRRDQDIADGIGPDSFQALSLDWVPKLNRLNPNTGVWLLRNIPETSDFLDAVEEAGIQPGPWADQAAVMKSLGWKWDDEDYRNARPGSGSPFLDGTSWLGEGWNQPDLTAERCIDSWDGRPSVERPHIVHFMGMYLPERTLKMARLANELALQDTVVCDISSVVTASSVIIEAIG
jgi:hypothetical protein